MSRLVEHAESELRRAGLFDKDSDYDGMLGPAVLELVKVHAAQGHSGFSHSLTLQIFNKVANFKTLGPLTSAPDEWMEVGREMSPPGAKDVWQNKRQGSCFSNDGGKTYYDIDAGDERALKNSAEPGAK